MDRIRLWDKEFELFIPEQKIQNAIAEMAQRIKTDIADSNPLFVSILNGAFMFTSDLMRELNGPYELTFARYSSYRGTSTTGSVQEIMPVKVDVKDRMVFLLEDIIDTGTTMQYVMNKLREQGAREVRLATMLYKPEAMRCNLVPDYVGLEIPTDFIVGYGLDYDELGRAYRDIYKLKSE
ncbi:hypoxanthine phosphoribosyltransferase [Parabacteroides sp. PF5-6]|uniref:hypoxanthine phosphoribosyltransferase n=1 Tax=Parabacteroides sp. PF5-6 TaxID=1742403 RepID=UPI0024066A84|nr:hypoxanthine phosphoribosyltransferase [Parabacteroides sp. PF5-6]MDF9831038.1 hypoxanthine phosphoribosyltransferase [Parabacteroides sp. PF5-6]